MSSTGMLASIFQSHVSCTLSTAPTPRPYRWYASTGTSGAELGLPPGRPDSNTVAPARSGPRWFTDVSGGNESHRAMLAGSLSRSCNAA